MAYTENSIDCSTFSVYSLKDICALFAVIDKLFTIIVQRQPLNMIVYHVHAKHALTACIVMATFAT